MIRLLRIFGLTATYTVHASAEQTESPCRILFGDICVPCGTHSCSRHARLQTCLHCWLLRIFVACAPHILFTPRQSNNRIPSNPSIWRYMRALRHLQLLEACTAANMFAPYRALASVASLLISPNRVMQINLLCSRLLRIFAHLF